MQLHRPTDCFCTLPSYGSGSLMVFATRSANMLEAKALPLNLLTYQAAAFPLLRNPLSLKICGWSRRVTHRSPTFAHRRPQERKARRVLWDHDHP